MDDFVTAKQRDFYHGGRRLTLRGLGVGSWLNFEHFMLGLPGWDEELRACLDAHYPGLTERLTDRFFTREDAAYLRSLGVNLIRVPFRHQMLLDDRTDTLIEEGFARLTALADACEAEGLYFLPDMHTAPGGQNPDWHSGCRSGMAEFWHYGVFRARAAFLWGEIARRLSHYRMLLGYDLLNEPYLAPRDMPALNAFYAEATAAIRRSDAQHLVFLEGNQFSMDFSGIAPPADARVAYSFHLYPAVWESELPQFDRAGRKAAIGAALDRVLGTMGGYRGPLLCGETGYELTLLEEEKGLSLTEDTLAAFEARGVSWCLWCYKDVGFMGLVRPAPDSPWMALCRELAKVWNHHRAERLGYRLAEEVSRQCSYDLSQDERYALQFILRAAVARADVAHLLSPVLDRFASPSPTALADSFSLDACRVYRPLETLLKAFTKE